MAERNRPADDAADDRPDDDEVQDELESDETDEPVSRGGTATVAKAKPESEDEVEVAKARKDRARVGFFGRIGRFFREVVAELRKVIWPTRKELLTYTAVVVSFLTVMTAIVTGLDYAFAKFVLWALGA